MARYQIRTSDNEYLEDVINKMAENGWKILRSWDVFDTPGADDEDFRKFRNRIRDSMVARVRTYRLCGLSNICSENLRSTQWAAPSHVMDANPWDVIYHVFPRTNLESFLTELTWNAIAAVKARLKSGLEEASFSSLRMVFQAVLGEYLYVNPVCGKTELCVYSSSAPTKVWQKKDQREEETEEKVRGTGWDATWREV